MKKFILKLKLLYYTILSYFEDDDNPTNLWNVTAIERRHENSKLARGVKKLVRKLRGMDPRDRTKVENLLGDPTYKKNYMEKREELEVMQKVNENPILRTEDDLVNKVVKEAPKYALEKDISDLRKQITACRRRLASNPNDPVVNSEFKALNAKLRALKGKS